MYDYLYVKLLVRSHDSIDLLAVRRTKPQSGNGQFVSLKFLIIYELNLLLIT